MIKSFLNRNHFINYYKCGKKIKKKQEGGDVEKNEEIEKNKKVSETLYDLPQMNYPPSDLFLMKKRRNSLTMNQNGGFIPFDKCGKKIKKKQEGGNVESSKPTKTHKVPFVVIDNNGKKKTTYVKDEATRDSLYANRYYDDEVLAVKPGNWIKGKWTPDRTKAPYKVKKGLRGLAFYRLEHKFPRGHSIVSETVLTPQGKNSDGTWYYPDFADISGRNIYVSPHGNDTIYFNYPDSYNSYGSSLLPLGDTKNLTKAKAKFLQLVRKAQPYNKDSKQALERARIEK